MATDSDDHNNTIELNQTVELNKTVALNKTVNSDRAERPDSSRRFSLTSMGFGRGLVVVLLPVAAGFAAYWFSANASANLSKVQDLVSLAIGAVVGILVFMVAGEVTILRLRRQLPQEFRRLGGDMTALTGQISELETMLVNIREIQRTKAFFDKKEGLSEARKLQDKAKRRVETMWTLFPYDDTLLQYFEQTLARPNIYTVRIVAANTVPREHLLDHIERSWQYLADDSYELYLIRECNYEAMIVDSVSAAGLFFYLREGYGSFFISGDSDVFVPVIQGLFRRQLESPATRRVPIAKGAATEDELARIAEWLDCFYEAMAQAEQTTLTLEPSHQSEARGSSQPSNRAAF